MARLIDIRRSMMDSFHKIIARFFNDTTLLDLQYLSKGDTPSYTGSAPTKPGAVFTGWDPEITAIYYNTDYMATFVDLLTYQYLKGTTKEFTDDTITSISAYGFYGRANLKSFESDSITTLRSYAFGYCTALESLESESITSVGDLAFVGCTALKKVDFKSTSPVTIGNAAFINCTALKDVIIRSSTVSVLSTDDGFQGTPIADGNGGIFVPAALVESYKSATNWVLHENNIFSIDDYPLDSYS